VETLAPQPLHRSAQLVKLASDYLRPEVSVGTRLVARETDLRRDIEDDCDAKYVVLLRQVDKDASRFGLHVRGVDHGQTSCRESFARDVTEHVECVLGRRLVGLVVAYEAAKEV